MNVKDTITTCIVEYPSLYKDKDLRYSREKVLDQLFFTNGCGYGWINGELIGGNYVEGVVIPDDFFSVPIYKESLDWEDNPISIEQCSYSPLNIYPICKYANILNIPTNIKDDWLDASEEAIEVALDYYRSPYKNCNQLYIAEWIDNREYYKIDEYISNQIDYLESAESIINTIRMERTNE